MGKLSFLLGLTTVLLASLSCIVAIEITDIFTVQSGADDGGCDTRAAVLDQWLSEGIESLAVALAAIDDYYNDLRVQRSMNAIFGIKLPTGRSDKDVNRAVGEVRQNIQWVEDFYNRALDEYDNPTNDRAGFFLFCHSTFLSMLGEDDPASDYEGNDILNEDGSKVRIKDIPEYAKELAKDPKAKPWWAGELTDLNGYYFTEDGGNYCYTDELGLTADIQLLRRGASGQAEVDNEIHSVILCPYSFDGSPQPNSYRDANKLLKENTNLADAVPKSATLLHEMFHALRGGFFLTGNDEKYTIAECINLPSKNAKINPENYVFFIAHMYHMRGKEEGEQPWSISTNWDFAVQGPRSTRIFGAIETEQVNT